MKRVLFLDVDYVLNCVAYLAQTKHLRDAAREKGEPFDFGLMIDPARVARLNRIIEGLNVLVVLSSSWRYSRTIDEMDAILASRGFASKLHDYTPVLSAGGRHIEIKRWLERQYPAVERFAILDDMEDAGVGMTYNFVQTTQGIEEEHVVRARQVLT